MADSPHRLGRLTADIRVADLDLALKLRGRAEDLVWTLAPQVMARVFDALVPAEVHLRLDRLDLDLGAVSPEHLERDGLAALERALTRALADALRRAPPVAVVESGQGSAGEDQARLERLDVYLTRGVTPLRPPGAPFDPAKDLADLAARAPDALAARLRARAAQPGVLERLAIQGGETGLRALAAALAPGETGALLTCLDDLLRASGPAGAASLAPPDRRRALWRAALAWLLNPYARPFSRAAFLTFLRDEAGDPAVVLAAAVLATPTARAAANAGGPAPPPALPLTTGRSATGAREGLTLAPNPRAPPGPPAVKGSGETRAVQRGFRPPHTAGEAIEPAVKGSTPPPTRTRTQGPVSADSAGAAAGSPSEADGAPRDSPARPPGTSPKPAAAGDGDRSTQAGTVVWSPGDETRPPGGSMAEETLSRLLGPAAAAAEEEEASSGATRTSEAQFTGDATDPTLESATGRGFEARLTELLLKLAGRDTEAFVARLRALAGGDRAEAFALARRVLEVLPPETILSALRPGEPAGDEDAAQAGIDRPGSEGGESWETAIVGALLGEAMPVAGPSPGLGERFDSLAAAREVLDSGAPPAPESARAALIAELPYRPWVDLWLIFAEGDVEAIEARLTAALEFLAPEPRERLLVRLAEEDTTPDVEDLEAAPAGLTVGWNSAPDPETVRLDPKTDRQSGGDRPRPSPAEVTAIHGPAGELWRTVVRRVAGRWAGPAGRAETPARAIAQDHRDRPAALADGAEAERAALLAWLSGAGPDRAVGAGAMRRLAEWAAREDAVLDAALRRGVAESAVRARWSAGLTETVLARILRRLAPSRAARLITVMTLIAAAARQAPPPGARPGPNRLPWAAVLGFVATPRPPDHAALAAALAREMAGGAGQAGATALLNHARRLARAGGHPEALAALWEARRLNRGASLARSAEPGPRAGAGAAPVPPALGEAIYVANAGLVLFNPYLPAFFDRLGLLSEGEDGVRRVRGLAAASRATHLLQYLVDGRLDQPEPDLALNKVLAGLDPAAPVTARLDPPPSDLALCDSLVAAVIANWPMLRGSSPEALRETFLRRDGRLTREDRRWALRVQRRTVDVLVDRIPWTLSVVYHRWMIDPIHVTW